jgi:ABC-type branched-subunit amino acid transport system ATPase component
VSDIPGGQRPEILADIQHVGFTYGGAWAVRDCSFSIPQGRVTGLIGPNGAGKTTLMEMLSGSIRPRTGQIIFEGIDVTRMGAAERAQLGIVRTFQTARVLPRLPVIENVMIAAQSQLGERAAAAILFRRRWVSQEKALRSEAAELVGWLGLSEHLYHEARTLSGGQQRLLEMARALMAHPKMLLLDEPTAGVYPEISQLIATRVNEIARNGVTVLVVAHNMGFLANIASEVVVMAEGTVLTSGSLEYNGSHVKEQLSDPTSRR